jgi:Sec-independent protein translocase protein TatA
VILVAVIFWRGPKNLPKLGEALGRGIRAARHEASEVQRDKETGPSPDSRAGE